MKGNAKDYASTAHQFFTAYDAHDVDGMLGLCADGLTLAAAAAINTVLPPICGSGTLSSNFSFSGPPYSCSTTAFIAFLPELQVYSASKSDAREPTRLNGITSASPVIQTQWDKNSVKQARIVIVDSLREKHQGLSI